MDGTLLAAALGERENSSPHEPRFSGLKKGQKEKYVGGGEGVWMTIFKTGG